MVAAQNTGLDVMRYLLLKGSVVDYQDGIGQTTLMKAIAMFRFPSRTRQNHFDSLEIILQLLVVGSNPAIVDKFGSTALWEALKTETPFVISLVFQACARIEEGESSEFSSSEDLSKYAKRIKAVLIERFRASCPDDGTMVLKYAFRSGLWHPSESVDNEGNTFLMVLAGHPKEASPKCRDIITLMIDHWGADIHASSHVGMTPLLLAADEGNASIFRLFEEKGANVHAVDKDGRNAEWHPRHGESAINLREEQLRANSIRTDMRYLNGWK